MPGLFANGQLRRRTVADGDTATSWAWRKRRRSDMDASVYTPGHSRNATGFMSRRTVHTHGGFFTPHLTPGVSVLDCGCGPGPIAVGIASMLAPASVTGVDFGASQVDRARAAAAAAGVANAEFKTADCF